MFKRKFSIDRLYTLIKYLIINICIIGFIGSAITFTISMSYQNKLEKIDKSVVFPKYFENRTFMDLDELLLYVVPPIYHDPAERWSKHLSPQQKEEKGIRREEERTEYIKRAEFEKLIKLPSNFSDARQLKNHREGLRDKGNYFMSISLRLFSFSLIAQIVFWGLVLLIRYLFPIAKLENQ